MDEIKHASAQDLQRLKGILGTEAVQDAIGASGLIKTLRSGKKLRVYFGIDPTSPEVHLGHTVPLRVLEAFQLLGHQVILLIGDFTARIGDPSGRDKTRTVLTERQIKENVKTYQEQVGAILSLRQTEVRYNSEWYSKLTLSEFFRHAYQLTAGQLWERDMFQRRVKASQPISLAEFLYPYLQGYDAVALQADVQIGGNDQLFNMLVSRDLCKKLIDKDQAVVVTPIINGSDGRKMSKSFGNAIGLNLSAEEMFGRLMHAGDELIVDYARYFGDWHEIERELKKLLRAKQPKTAKVLMACSVVERYHSLDAAQAAERKFDETFRQKKVPTSIRVCRLSRSTAITQILVECNLAASLSEAKRLIAQSGVKLNSRTVSDPNQVIQPSGQSLQVGKRKFVKLGG